jgi:tRNA dimethylallyltransferase
VLICHSAQDGKPLPVICLAGPTGSGKTALALVLAEELGGEIINADSRQVYADFPIITAQPPAEERACCPHHGYGFLPSDRKISAGHWAETSCEIVHAVLKRGKTPLLVGGTGLYFQTLLRGIAAVPPVDPAVGAKLEARLEDVGLTVLYRELADVDAAYAARIHHNDKQRILRALEVFYATKHPFTWWHANAMSAPLCSGPLIVLKAELDALTPRLAQRIDRMIADGAFEEAGNALARCPDASAPVWSGIGAAEVLACLQGRISRMECVEFWLKRTRAYAKRQLTWFRAREEAHFIMPEDAASALSLAREHTFGEECS